MDGSYIATAVTDKDGRFLFTGVLPGDYYLAFTPPAGYDFTLPYQGDETLDSDADPVDGTTAVFRLIAGQVDPTLDAGLIQLGGGATSRFRGRRR